MRLSDYPLFMPPDHLAVKGRERWNAKEANEYRQWMLGVQNARVEALKKLLGVPSEGSFSDRLMMAGEEVAKILQDAPFSEESPVGRRLTNRGYAISADMGLLVASYLIERLNGKIRWEVIRKPKTELSYNLPVLMGFSSTYLDPVGGSIAEAQALLRGQRGGDAWRRIYEYWLAKGY
jgi:hypothetical protein